MTTRAPFYIYIYIYYVERERDDACMYLLPLLCLNSEKRTDLHSIFLQVYFLKERICDCRDACLLVYFLECILVENGSFITKNYR